MALDQIPLLLVAYLIGCFPSGLLIARMHGVDLRSVGSGNVGATNATRALGKRAGALVLLLDVTKGVLAVSALPLLAGTLPPLGAPTLSEAPSISEALPLALGFFVTAGHCFPFYAPRSGGKGVATALGTLLAESSALAIIAIALFAGVFSLTRIVSVSSLAASLAVAVSTFAMPMETDEQCFIFALAALLTVKHHANIKRILRGEEPRFKRPS